MGENEEEKGFKIVDRRHSTEEAEEKQSEPSKSTDAPMGDKSTDAPMGETPEVKRGPQAVPEIDFKTFVLSLSTSALLHFGEIPDPVTNEKEINLPLARQSIDILTMLQEKTKGNLNKEEEDLLENILYNLRMKYIEESKK